jgi:hypothetical protein
MKPLFFIFALAAPGCARPADQVGRVVTDFHIECLKEQSQTGTGFSSKGSLVFTTTESCVASQCYKRVSRLGKRFGKFDVLSDDAAEMKDCVAWKAAGNDL